MVAHARHESPRVDPGAESSTTVYLNADFVLDQWRWRCADHIQDRLHLKEFVDTIAYLSAVLLVGLVLNATLGWSWADPVAGLVIAAVAIREGLEARRGEGCARGPAVAEHGPLEPALATDRVDDCCPHPADH